MLILFANGINKIIIDDKICAKESNLGMTAGRLKKRIQIIVRTKQIDPW